MRHDSHPGKPIGTTVADAPGPIRSLFPDARIVMCCLGFAALELAIVGSQNAGYWGNTALAWYLRLGLAALTVLVWMCIACCWEWGAAFLRTLDDRMSKARASGIAAAILCPLFAAFYIASLALFWRTGTFAESEAIRMLFVNTRMLMHYFVQTEPIVLGGFILSIVALSGLLCHLHRRMKSQPRNTPHRLLGCAAILLLTCDVAFLLVWSDVHRAAETDPPWWHARPGVAYELRARTSPVLSLCASILFPNNAQITGELDEHELGPPQSASFSQPMDTGKPELSVVLIAVESLRHDVIGATHQGHEIMPHVNQLAKEGRRFTRAYAQSTHSDYADPCLLSSQYPLRSPRHHYYSRADPWPKLLIYDVLKQAGFQTAVFSSQNEGWGNMADFIDSPQLDVFFDSRQYRGPTHASDKDGGFSRYVSEGRMSGKLDDAVTVEQAGDWIREQTASESPFFLYLNLQSSHFPYQTPAAEKLFQPCQIEFGVSFSGYPADKVEHVRNAYFNSLRYVDDQIGALLDVLHETGTQDNVLLVITGDNGEAFYENGHPTHAGPPFESAIHVGLVMHCPQLLSAGVNDNLTQTIDVCPTILGLLHLPGSPCFQGFDVFGRNSVPKERRLAFIHCESVLSGADAVISATGWKYLHDRRSGECRLHNLHSDPGEQHNRIETSPEIAQVFSRLLAQWRKRQLLYHQSQRYYGFYFPPPTPELSDDDFALINSQ